MKAYVVDENSIQINGTRIFNNGTRHHANGTISHENGTMIHHNGTMVHPNGTHVNMYEGTFSIKHTCELPQRYFTQGLEMIDDSTLLISSGRYGESKILTMDFEINADGCTFEEGASQELDAEYFGEGATFVEESMLVY